MSAPGDPWMKLSREYLEDHYPEAAWEIDALLAERDRLAAELKVALHRAEGWVQHDTEAYAAATSRAIARAEAAEARADRLTAALELKDSAYAHLKSGQTAKAERLAAESWRRRSDGALAASSGGEA